jgi:hypothetical protein
LANVSSKVLKAALAARSNQGRTNNNTHAVVLSDTTPPGHRYCYHHGHTKNHGWFNGVLTSPCKHVAARPQQFNAAKLQAQTCQACAGGSKNVQQVCPSPSAHASSPSQKIMSKNDSLSYDASSTKKPNTRSSPRSSKPEYENPFVVLQSPPPVPPPSFPRDDEGQPIYYACVFYCPPVFACV